MTRVEAMPQERAESKGTVDWTVTSCPAMSRAFVADVPPWVVTGSGTPGVRGLSPGAPVIRHG